MTSVIIHLREGRCVQGAARTRHSELVASLLEADRDPLPDEADEVELLAAFLEGTDFGALRAQRPILDGRQEVSVSVSRDESGAFAVDVVAQETS